MNHIVNPAYVIGLLMTVAGLVSTQLLLPYVVMDLDIYKEMLGNLASGNSSGDIPETVKQIQATSTFGVVLFAQTNVTVIFVLMMMIAGLVTAFRQHSFICHPKALLNKAGAAVVFTGLILQLAFNQYSNYEAATFGVFVPTTKPLVAPLTLLFTGLWGLRTHSNSPYYHALPIIASVFSVGAYLMTYSNYFMGGSDAVKNRFDVKGTSSIEKVMYYCVMPIAEALFHTLTFAYFRRHLRLGALERAMFGNRMVAGKAHPSDSHTKKTSNPHRFIVLMSFVAITSFVACGLLWIVPFAAPKYFHLPESDRFAPIQSVWKQMYTGDLDHATDYMFGYVVGHAFILVGFALLNSISAPLTAFASLAALPALNILWKVFPNDLLPTGYNNDSFVSELGYNIGGLLLVLASVVLYTVFLLQKPPRYEVVNDEETHHTTVNGADAEYKGLRLEENPHLL